MYLTQFMMVQSEITKNIFTLYFLQEKYEETHHHKKKDGNCLLDRKLTRNSYLNLIGMSIQKQLIRRKSMIESKMAEELSVYSKQEVGDEDEPSFKDLNKEEEDISVDLT